MTSLVGTDGCGGSVFWPWSWWRDQFVKYSSCCACKGCFKCLEIWGLGSLQWREVLLSCSPTVLRICFYNILLMQLEVLWLKDKRSLVMWQSWSGLISVMCLGSDGFLLSCVCCYGRWSGMCLILLGECRCKLLCSCVLWWMAPSICWLCGDVVLDMGRDLCWWRFSVLCDPRNHL